MDAPVEGGRYLPPSSYRWPRSAARSARSWARASCAVPCSRPGPGAASELRRHSGERVAAPARRTRRRSSKLALDALAAAGLEPCFLTVEITEGVLLERPGGRGRRAGRAGGSGCGLSLDDFGTGYSSLSYLGELPFDSVKIDRSLITADRRQRAGGGARIGDRRDGARARERPSSLRGSRRSSRRTCCGRSAATWGRGTCSRGLSRPGPSVACLRETPRFPFSPATDRPPAEVCPFEPVASAAASRGARALGVSGSGARAAARRTRRAAR